MQQSISLIPTRPNSNKVGLEGISSELARHYSSVVGPALCHSSTKRRARHSLPLPLRRHNKKQLLEHPAVAECGTPACLFRWRQGAVGGPIAAAALKLHPLGTKLPSTAIAPPRKNLRCRRLHAKRVFGPALPRPLCARGYPPPTAQFSLKDRANRANTCREVTTPSSPRPSSPF